MADKYNLIPTVTDSDDYKVDVLNEERFNDLEETDQKIWEKYRDSMLEIFPVVNGKHDNLSINYAENFAFISLTMIDILIEEKINSKINSLRQEFSNSEEE